MKVIKQSAKLLYVDKQSGIDAMKRIEFAGRNCYASHDKITEDSYKRFVKGLISRGHDAPVEFADLTFDITTSRAVLAEITRHRLASFCVESQRYIQEAKTGFITFIVPEWAENINKQIENELDKDYEAQYNEDEISWLNSINFIENKYVDFIANNKKPEEAREVLPNSTACRIIMKANAREWRHFFQLRCSPAAYPQMRKLALEMLRQAYNVMPEVFEDIAQQYLERKDE